MFDENVDMSPINYLILVLRTLPLSERKKNQRYQKPKIYL